MFTRQAAGCHELFAHLVCTESAKRTLLLFTLLLVSNARDKKGAMQFIFLSLHNHDLHNCPALVQLT